MQLTFENLVEECEILSHKLVFLIFSDKGNNDISQHENDRISLDSGLIEQGAKIATLNQLRKDDNKMSATSLHSTDRKNTA